MKHIVKAVTPGSIAEEMAIAPGDELLTINGQKIKDVLDYRFLTQDEQILLEIQKPDGELWELDIEKEAEEDIGLIFTRALMDEPKQCRNKCVFCFIDQMPPDLRGTLYFKDDDPRLSFLTGNYITLTNLTPQEVRHVTRYHLSPLHISVHAADPEIRRKLTGNPHAGRFLKILRLFNEAGITLHFQVVLCRGINDGAALDYTIKTLLRFRPGAASLSVVPAGLTQYRKGLFPLTPFNAEESAAVVRQITRWQKKIRARYGMAFVFCADEFYLQAGLPIPSYTHYEDFPQLENGVGMMSLFAHNFKRRLARCPSGYAAGEAKIDPAINGIKNSITETASIKIGIITGSAAHSFMEELTQLFHERYPTVLFCIYPVENQFFGSEITVSGLLTGRDIVQQTGERIRAEDISVLFLPRNAFRAKSPVMLDNTTLPELEEALGIPVKIGSADGGRFCRQLYKTIQAASPY